MDIKRLEKFPIQCVLRVGIGKGGDNEFPLTMQRKSKFRGPEIPTFYTLILILYIQLYLYMYINTHIEI